MNKKIKDLIIQKTKENKLNWVEKPSLMEDAFVCELNGITISLIKKHGIKEIPVHIDYEFIGIIDIDLFSIIKNNRHGKIEKTLDNVLKELESL